MGDVSMLLREAVPIEDVEPDLDAVTNRVRSRLRRRGVLRGAACVAAVALAGVTASVALGGRDSDDGVVAIEEPGADRYRADAGRLQVEPVPLADIPDGTEFATWLATRPWLARFTPPDWPTEPGAFLDGSTVPTAVVVGTLREVRPGTSDANFCMYIQGCMITSYVDTVISVDRVLLGPADELAGELVVPWKEDFYVVPPDDLAHSAPTAPAVAPVGARVLVFLNLVDEGVWRPVEPSGMVIEDPDGVAIAQPGGSAPDLAWSFDGYVAEVEALLSAP